jgi:hypothetical protein
MPKKIKDLTADDFPGIVPVKFAEWKEARISSNRNLIFSYSVLFLIMLLAQLKVFNFGGIQWLFCAVVIIPINYLATAKFRKLSKELNISGKAIRDVLRKP